MIRSNHTRVVALASAVTLLAGCGGGAGAIGSSTLPTQPTNAAKGTSATFIVKVPAKAGPSSSRRPHYITANVKSIDFTVSQPGNAALSFYTFYTLTPQSTYCTSSTSGLTCSLQVQAAPGADTFVVNLYDATEPGQGWVVATGSLVQTISAQTSNTISITTDGVPTFANLGLGNPYPATGSATSTPITLNIADPDGDIIIGSYDMPLALTDSDTSGATALSKTTLSQASDATGVVLNYTGAALANPATISLVSSSPVLRNVSPTLASGVYAPAGIGPIASPSTLYFSTASANAQTLTITGSPGSTGPFTVTEPFGGNGCGPGAFVTITGSSPTFTVTPNASTTSATAPTYLSSYGCQLAVTDSNNNTTYMGFIVGL
jgi:hypothetical protein